MDIKHFKNVNVNIFVCVFRDFLKTTSRVLNQNNVFDCAQTDFLSSLLIGN